MHKCTFSITSCTHLQPPPWHYVAFLACYPPFLEPPGKWDCKGASLPTQMSIDAAWHSHSFNWTWIVVRSSGNIGEHLQKLSETTSLYLSMPMGFQLFRGDLKWWVRYQESCCWVEVFLGKASHSSSPQRAGSSGVSGQHELTLHLCVLILTAFPPAASILHFKRWRSILEEYCLDRKPDGLITSQRQRLLPLFII